MIDFIVCLLTIGMAVLWYQKRGVVRLKDTQTQTDIDTVLMNLIYDTSPLPSIASSDIFHLSDLELDSDEPYLGDTELLDGEE
jgi:hypothetical protein